MRDFVLRRNLQHFQRLLLSEQDADQRRILEGLLADTARALAALRDSDPVDLPPRQH